jgi:8-oxo-dGTP pyrophosphatase MutT (NUDIX family)
MLWRLARWIERHPRIHRLALDLWRRFPPRLAGFLKGRFARNWLVGAVAVMVDTTASPPQVLLVEHSYRRKGTWGLPGGSLESVPGSPTQSGGEAAPDDVIESALRREVWEELGIGIEAIRLLRVDAVPYIPEEPGPYRLDFYYRCEPEGGFAPLRAAMGAGDFGPRSPEIRRARLVPLTEVDTYDLFSADARFLKHDLPRLVPEVGIQ